DGHAQTEQRTEESAAHADAARGMIAPLMEAAASDSRKAIVSATLPSGTRCASAPACFITAGVARELGATALTVTPLPRASAAATSISALSADFDTVYAADPPPRRSAATELTATIRPAPRMTASASRMTKNAPVALRASI